MSRILSFIFLFIFSLFLSNQAKAQITYVGTKDTSIEKKVYADQTGTLYEDEALKKTFKVKVKCFDPQNNLKGSYRFIFREFGGISDSLGSFASLGKNGFEIKLNCDSGKTVSDTIVLTEVGLEALQNPLSGSELELNTTLAFDSSTRPDPGFVGLGLDLTVCDKTTQVGGKSKSKGKNKNSGDSSEEESGPSLAEGLEEAEATDFETILIQDVKDEEKETPLVVNFTYKIDKAVYDLVVAGLKEGEDITEKAKALAKQFSVKLNLKNLKKLAKQELDEAAEGLEGEEREEAIEEAEGKGINKLVDTIVFKLPSLPPRKARVPADIRARIKTIRKAKKKKILDALEVELAETKDGKVGEKDVKCLTFKITLPTNVCPKKAKSKKTVRIANLEFLIDDFGEGETLTVDLEAQVVGTFGELLPGTINIPLTLSN